MNEDKKPKRFEDWEEVSCNDCARYWDNTCDAVPKGSQRLCNSFSATRSVVIPQQIKWLKSVLKWLVVGLIFVAIWVFVLTCKMF